EDAYIVVYVTLHGGSPSLTGFDRHGIEERHHRAQLRADRLDRLILLGAPRRLEARRTGGDLGDPRLGERAAADVAEQTLHGRARLGADHLIARDVVAPLRGIRHRIPHVVEPAAIHQIDDQLELVQTLEVGD